MGRRALRKIDPAIDLTGHLKTFEQLPRPWDAATLFGREAALEIEVGSGKGLFLRSAAAARPEINFLGIEVVRKYAQFAAAAISKVGLGDSPNFRVNENGTAGDCPNFCVSENGTVPLDAGIRHGLKNALMVHADALQIFHELLPDNSLSAVHVYFPDPWWKLRHRKRRVMRETFLHDVQRTLRPGGSLHFWTDVEEYYRTSLELLAACTTLLGPLPVPETPAEHDMAYRTHFERRVRLANEPVYRAEYKKRDVANK